VLAIETLLEGRSIGPRNLGTGHGCSNRQVLAAVERVLGKPVPVEEAPRRPGDPPELVADATLFRQEFGWKPHYSDLTMVVATAWAWLQRWRNLTG
jgi:UDP-glucose 4-epimerase